MNMLGSAGNVEIQWELPVADFYRIVEPEAGCSYFIEMNDDWMPGVAPHPADVDRQPLPRRWRPKRPTPISPGAPG